MRKLLENLSFAEQFILVFFVIELIMILILALIIFN